MRGISFDYPQTFSAPHPYRMDVACFVGFVALRNEGVPASLRGWLRGCAWRQRWEQEAPDLIDLPVPVESWEAFNDLFAWERRVDRKAEISSAALEASITVTEQDAILQVGIDGALQAVTLATGTHDVADLAAQLDSALEEVAVRVEQLDNAHYLRFSFDANTAVRLTVAANAALGFSSAASVSSSYADCNLGAAVKAFFAQGGRKCYVVRMGDPDYIDTSDEARIAQLAHLLFGDAQAWQGLDELSQLASMYFPPFSTPDTPPEYWHGIEHLMGLPEVSYLSLPDLPELVSTTSQPVPQIGYPRLAKERFVECAVPVAEARQLSAVPWDAPRCEEEGYRAWARVLQTISDFIARRRRDVQLIASIPLPHASCASDFQRLLHDECLSETNPLGCASAFLQLTYPWVKTAEGKRLPGGVVPPEALLVGMLASHAWSNGAFLSAAGGRVDGGYGFLPKPYDSRGLESALGDRISLFSLTPSGIELWSDATASDDPAYRPAAVNRLMMLVLRAARLQAQALTFESSSPRLWRSVEMGLGAMLTAVYEAGGLRGASSAEAFEVSCNRGTMTQNDIDNGRTIASISLQPAVPVAHIHVRLALEGGGHVALTGGAS